MTATIITFPARPAADITTGTDRDEAIAAIRKALRARSGKSWSVTGGRGTAWGWITVTAPPARRATPYAMTAEDTTELATLFGLDRVSHQGVSIADSTAHRAEYIARAEGRPATVAAAYWD